MQVLRCCGEEISGPADSGGRGQAAERGGPVCCMTYLWGVGAGVGGWGLTIILCGSSPREGLLQVFERCFL